MSSKQFREFAVLLQMRPYAPLKRGQFAIEKPDKTLLSEQVSIALKAYEEKNIPHQGPLENFLGLTAELTFNQFLQALGLQKEIDYEWNGRRLDQWEREDRRLWDFRLKEGSIFEIGEARPYHQLAVCKASKHKLESKYFVQVQIKRLRCVAKVYHKGKERWYKLDAHYKGKDLPELTKEDALELESEEGHDIGMAVIRGFDKVATILAKENGWEFSHKGEPITPYAPGYIKPLDELGSCEDLIRLILRKCGRESKIAKILLE